LKSPTSGELAVKLLRKEVNACSRQIAIRFDRDSFEGLVEVSGDYSMPEFVDNSAFESDQVLEAFTQLGCCG